MFLALLWQKYLNLSKKPGINPSHWSKIEKIIWRDQAEPATAWSRSAAKGDQAEPATAWSRSAAKGDQAEPATARSRSAGKARSHPI